MQKRQYRSDPVGVIEIAKRLGVKDRSVHMWRYRTERGEMGVGLGLPVPDHRSVNGHGAWEWRTILAWAGRTGRLRDPDLAAEYRKLTGEDPAPEHQGGQRGQRTSAGIEVG